MVNIKDLYQKYSSEVYRFACWLTGNAAEAEDITSETFLRAWTNLKVIKTETLKAYLFTIARNVYFQHLRKQKRQVELVETYPDSSPDPERVIETKENLQLVNRILQTLSESDQTAFVLRMEHDLPYAEIARILALSEVAVKVKVHRIRKQLMQRLLEKEVP